MGRVHDCVGCVHGQQAADSLAIDWSTKQPVLMYLVIIRPSAHCSSSTSPPPAPPFSHSSR